MNNYECTTCGKVLPISEFYAEKSKRGHTKRCKECLCIYRREWAKNNTDIVERNRIQYKPIHAINERSRRMENPDRMKEINMRTYNNHKEKYKALVAEYRLRYPEKERAHNILKNAIRSGKIIKPKKCEICDRTTKVQGHHEDYDKPLEVVWMCGSCHSLYHKGKYDTAHRIAADLGIALKESSNE